MHSLPYSTKSCKKSSDVGYTPNIRQYPVKRNNSGVG